jgi:hypothetical protein
MSSSVLPNRKAFADYITRLFIKANLRSKGFDAEDEDADLCTKQGSSSSTQELMPYQKLVRDYLLIETPYRGVLVYHGLGSGKTCSAIGVAESLLSNKKVFVMLPASLQSNFRQQLRKCGDPIYMTNNHWEVRTIRTLADKEPALALGISDDFLRSQGRYFITVPDRVPNYESLPMDLRRGIDAQIADMIDHRYTFVNYNGLTAESAKLLVPEEDPTTSKTFNDSVVIIDEAHNFISRVINRSEIATRVYNAMYHAQSCKVVMLSGTPVINKPNEVAYFMNLLRGPIERIILPTKDLPTWDEAALTKFFRERPDVDTIEFNSIKRLVYITRNPPHFKSVYNEKGNRIAVQYDASFERLTLDAWVTSTNEAFKAAFPGGEIGPADKVVKESLECLPTKFEDFVNYFIEGLGVKNALLFQRRVQGLVSYYKGADERMLPKRVDEDKILERIPMSDEQFNRYLEVRWKEIQMESRKAMRGPAALNEDFTTARVLSRLVCNYAVPPDLKTGVEDPTSEDQTVDKSAILAKLVAEPDRYLRPAGLALYSPKLKRALELVQASVGSEDYRNQFIYSAYRELEGLGIFGAILEANGFQRYRLVLENGVYREDPTLDPAKPAFAFYTGLEATAEREIMRYIFNEDYRGLEVEYPQHSQSIRQSIVKRGNKKLLCILMATSSGAEGINLMNVRHIHILEPHWNPARHDQVVGRGIRLCSHASRQRLDPGTAAILKETVPIEERTIRISFYVTVFSESQSTTTDGFNIVPIRRADTREKRYDAPDVPGARPPEAFMSSDEFLYEISYEKSRITAGITHLLKQAAVDCEIHRKLHSKEQPVLQCMRFDTNVKGEDLAYHPSIKDDDLDVAYLRNQMKRKRRLQRVKIKEFVLLLDPDTREVFDEPAFGDAGRLLPIGTLDRDRITFFTVSLS